MNRLPHRPRTVLTVLACLSLLAGVSWTALTRAAAHPLRQTQDFLPAFVPLALSGALPERTALPARATSTPEATPSATQEPTVAVTPSSTPTALVASRVVLQVASFGALAPDTQFDVNRVLRSPVYTLYEAGTVVVHPPDQLVARRYRPVVAWLEPAQADDLVANLIAATDLFHQPLPDESGLCVPDLDTTYVYLDAIESVPPRSLRAVAIYGLDWYAEGRVPCRPRTGTPQPPAAQWVALAEWVAALRVLPTDATPYWPHAGTLVVTRDRADQQAPGWPLGHDLALVSREFLTAGELTLLASDVPAAVAAVKGQLRAGQAMALFSQRGQNYRVGVRIEPPGWATYLEHLAPTATPGPSPEATYPCPPIAPRCTPGPRPTACSGPGCPTPDPCPCLP